MRIWTRTNLTLMRSLIRREMASKTCRIISEISRGKWRLSVEL